MTFYNVLSVYIFHIMIFYCVLHYHIILVHSFNHLHTLKMLGCFNPILGQIWTNPAIGLHF